MAPKLDLLVVADSLDGGLGAFAGAHARWFAEQGWRVGLASSMAHSAELAPAEGIHLDMPDGAFDVVRVSRSAAALRRVLHDRRPEIVHAHGTRSQLVTLAAGRQPYVTMHGAGRVVGQGAAGSLTRDTLRRVAPWLAKTAYSAAPSPGWKTLLCASPRLAELRHFPPPIESDVPTFLWVGRLDVPKLPALFVHACSLASRRRSLRGVVVGDGPLMSQTRALAAELSAPVEFLGERADIADQLARASAVCLFSDFEGVPFSVQEAMWAGRAVVLSDLPNLRWFAGDAALYARDAAGAAAAMEVLSDAGTARSWGALTATRIRALMTPEDPFPRLLRDYREGAAASWR